MLKRVVSGVLLVFFVVYLILYSSTVWILAVTSLIILLALLEFNNLGRQKIRDRLSDVLCVVTGVAMPLIFFIYGKALCLPVIMGTVFLLFLNGVTRAKDLKDAAYDIVFKIFGVVYLALPFSYLVLIVNIKGGRLWFLLMITIIWANDTFAFIAGKTVGKHRLAPIVSPKKTVEGAIGGLAGGVLAAYIFNRYLSMGMGMPTLVILSLALGVIGIIGDLAESLLKRSVGVKDSGSIIPGHGGMMDRIDSLVFPIPVLYYFLVLYLQPILG